MRPPSGISRLIDDISRQNHGNDIVDLNDPLEIKRLPVPHDPRSDDGDRDDIHEAEGHRRPGRGHHEPAVKAFVTDFPQFGVEVF